MRHPYLASDTYQYDPDTPPKPKRGFPQPSPWPTPGQLIRQALKLLFYSPWFILFFLVFGAISLLIPLYVYLANNPDCDETEIYKSNQETTVLSDRTCILHLQAVAPVRLEAGSLDEFDVISLEGTPFPLTKGKVPLGLKEEGSPIYQAYQELSTGTFPIKAGESFVSLRLSSTQEFLTSLQVPPNQKAQADHKANRAFLYSLVGVYLLSRLCTTKLYPRKK